MLRFTHFHVFKNIQLPLLHITLKVIRRIQLWIVRLLGKDHGLLRLQLYQLLQIRLRLLPEPNHVLLVRLIEVIVDVDRWLLLLLFRRARAQDLVVLIVGPWVMHYVRVFEQHLLNVLY